VDHEQARRKRLREAELKIEELTKAVEESKKLSEAFDEEVVREVADFERIKRAEFKQQLGGLADAHIHFFSETIEVWEKYMHDMEKEGVLAA
jgi:sorting nexin-4